MFLLFTMLLVAQRSAAVSTSTEAGVIRVIARDSQTAMPISGVEVRLRGPSPPVSLPIAVPAPTTPPPPPERKLVTDFDGTASFENLSPGAYTIQGQADGYRGTTPSSIPVVIAPAAASGYLELRADNPVQNYVLHFVRSGSVTGRVNGPDGKPVPNAKVTAIIASYREGRRALFEGQQSTTNERGEYRLPSLGPGEYYVRVTADTAVRSAAYHPGFTDFERAAAISIRGAEDIAGIDINVPEVPRFRISGSLAGSQLQGLPGSKTDGSFTQFAIVPAAVPADLAAAPSIPNPVVDSDGRFVIAGIPAGSWDLFAISPATEQAASIAGTPVRYRSSGRIRVNVIDRDIENVTILQNSADVRGRLIVQDSTGATERVAPLRLSLLPQDNVPAILGGQIRNVATSPATGEFNFYGVPAGNYNLSFLIPPGFYLSGLRLGPRSIYDDATVEVGLERPGPVEITLRSGGGTIAGILEDNLPQRPTQQYLEPRIVLVPQWLSQRDNILLYKTTTLIGPPGAFSFRNVPPGEYKVFAWESVPPLDAEKNPRFVSLYEPFGTSVTVVEGQTSTVHVQLIPFGR